MGSRIWRQTEKEKEEEEEKEIIMPKIRTEKQRKLEEKRKRTQERIKRVANKMPTLKTIGKTLLKTAPVIGTGIRAGKAVKDKLIPKKKKRKDPIKSKFKPDSTRRKDPIKSKVKRPKKTFRKSY